MNKESFEKYVRVQQSGVTNMFDLNKVCSLSGLSREECLDIMKNYNKYEEEYKE